MYYIIVHNDIHIHYTCRYEDCRCRHTHNTNKYYDVGTIFPMDEIMQVNLVTIGRYLILYLAVVE